MDTAKLSSKGQVTIPIDIRRRLGLHEGENVIFIERNNGVIITSEKELHTFMPGSSLEASSTGLSQFEEATNRAFVEPISTVSKNERLKTLRSLYGSIDDSTIIEPPEAQHESRREWELMDQ